MPLVIRDRCAGSVGWMAHSTDGAVEREAVGRAWQDTALLPAGKEPALCFGSQAKAYTY